MPETDSVPETKDNLGAIVSSTFHAVKTSLVIATEYHQKSFS